MPSQDQSSGKGSCEELKLPANSHLELWKPVLPPRQAVSQFSSVTQCVQLFATPWTAACQAILSITNSWSLLKLLSFESVRPFNPLILCRPLLLSPSVFPSIRVFSNESVLCFRWPYWSFSFSISPSSEYSGLISFRIDWLVHLQSMGLSRSFSSATVQKHQFFGAQVSLRSNSHIHT